MSVSPALGLAPTHLPILGSGYINPDEEAYAPFMVRFDGTQVVDLIDQAFMEAQAGKSCIISFWMRNEEETTASRGIFGIGELDGGVNDFGVNYLLGGTTGGTFKDVVTHRSIGGVSFGTTSTIMHSTRGFVQHVCIAVTAGSTSRLRLYEYDSWRDDGSATASNHTTATNWAPGASGAGWRLGQHITSAGVKADCYIGDLFIKFDVSIAATGRLDAEQFRSAEGKPIDPLSDGTGFGLGAPDFFMGGLGYGLADWNAGTNRGTNTTAISVPVPFVSGIEASPKEVQIVDDAQGSFQGITNINSTVDTPGEFIWIGDLGLTAGLKKYAADDVGSFVTPDTIVIHPVGAGTPDRDDLLDGSGFAIDAPKLKVGHVHEAKNGDLLIFIYAGGGTYDPTDTALNKNKYFVYHYDASTTTLNLTPVLWLGSAGGTSGKHVDLGRRLGRYSASDITIDDTDYITIDEYNTSAAGADQDIVSSWIAAVSDLTSWSPYWKLNVDGGTINGRHFHSGSQSPWGRTREGTDYPINKFVGDAYSQHFSISGPGNVPQYSGTNISGNATSMTDSGFVEHELVGLMLVNDVTGESGVITANTTTVVTAALASGWTNGVDTYTINVDWQALNDTTSAALNAALGSTMPLYDPSAAATINGFIDNYGEAGAETPTNINYYQKHKALGHLYKGGYMYLAVDADEATGIVAGIWRFPHDMSLIQNQAGAEKGELVFQPSKMINADADYDGGRYFGGVWEGPEDAGGNRTMYFSEMIQRSASIDKEVRIWASTNGWQFKQVAFKKDSTLGTGQAAFNYAAAHADKNGRMWLAGTDLPIVQRGVVIEEGSATAGIPVDLTNG